jgi:pimeloyl-[acyl-carrier protein] methyl ester esterase
VTTIVMRPGWGMKAAAYDALGERLRERFDVRALELPLDPAAAAVETPKRCFVVGWSLGAQLAIDWARTRPEQIARLALISATPSFVQREGWTCAMPHAVFEAFAATLEEDPRATLERFTLLQAQDDAAARRVARTLRSALVVADADSLATGLQRLRETDLRGSLGEIPQPALVIHGERDRLVPVEAAGRLTRALPEARLEVVAGAAHAPFVSDVGRVAALLGEFFDG